MVGVLKKLHMDDLFNQHIVSWRNTLNRFGAKLSPLYLERKRGAFKATAHLATSLTLADIATKNPLPVPVNMITSK